MNHPTPNEVETRADKVQRAEAEMQVAVERMSMMKV
jgi:hypothetical protein